MLAGESDVPRRTLTRFALLVAFAAFTFSTAAVAQKADAAFVVGGSFVSDSTVTFGIPCLIPAVPATARARPQHCSS